MFIPRSIKQNTRYGFLTRCSLPTLSAKVSLDFCIILDMLESASGCLGIYCFISIILCFMRILPFQTILLPFRYCSPALTHTHKCTHICTDNLSQYQAPQNHRGSDFTYLKGKEFQDINSTTQIVFTYATTYSVLQQDMGSWCEIIIMTRDLQ